jgi:hypothetical protein
MGSKSWQAVTYYRDFDGRTRQVERYGATGAKAERPAPGQAGRLTLDL